MPTSGGPSGFDTKLVKDLAKILRDTDLSEIEVEHEGTKVRVARIPAQTSVQHVMASAPPSGLPAAAPVANAAAAPPAATATPAADPAKEPGAVLSPMVGTIYQQPEPGAASFIKLGDTVKEGQQLFIIEAMKTMNPVAAPHAGTVTRILITDGQPVEFGEPLCIIA